MSTDSSVTETVVRNHLQAFLKQRGITAILNDYDDHAKFFSEAKVYQGKQEIGSFIMDFIGSLPPGAYDIFDLRTLRVDGDLVYITWSIGSAVPFGHRHVCCRQRQDRFTNVCHVCGPGSINLTCIPPASANDLLDTPSTLIRDGLHEYGPGQPGQPASRSQRPGDATRP